MGIQPVYHGEVFVSIKSRDRYKAKVIPFTNKEYDYVLKKFIDRRKWV